LMRRDLRAGMRIDYDEPSQLLQLYARAMAASGEPSTDTQAAAHEC
jgi:hypothetical protein